MKILTGDVILWKDRSILKRIQNFFYEGYDNVGLVVTGEHHYVYQCNDFGMHRIRIENINPENLRNTTVYHLCLEYHFSVASRIKMKMFAEEAYDVELVVTIPTLWNAFKIRGSMPFNQKLYRNWLFVLQAWVKAGIIPRYLYVPKVKDILSYLGGRLEVLNTSKG